MNTSTTTTTIILTTTTTTIIITTTSRQAYFKVRDNPTAQTAPPYNTVN
jgi:hypothetical protein